jgi:hypothetical protein
MPPNSRNWQSLAVASRGQRSRLQHWTAPIIGNHLILDPLVMSRSMSETLVHMDVAEVLAILVSLEEEGRP